jgi:hypothetical protein
MWVRGINVKVVLVARRRNVFGKKSCPSTLDQVLSGSGVGTVSAELTIACFSLWRERERERAEDEVRCGQKLDCYSLA